MRSSLLVLVLGCAASCLIGPTPGFGDGEQPRMRGYESRPCGFDVDKDGIVGEEGECDFCDGITKDPDGDGYEQPILYVHCDEGTDPEVGAEEACTDPGAPCRTINRAMAEIPNTSAADEQGIVCFTGTCTERVEVRSGRPHVATRAAQGIEVNDFDYPGEPSMLIGWDRDDNEEYPPYDTDEPATLRAAGDEQSSALLFGHGDYLTPSHDVEYAHFEVEPSGDGQPRRFMYVARSPLPYERIHLHDIVVDGFGAGLSPGDPGAVLAFTMEGYPDPPEANSGQPKYLAFENLYFSNHGGYLLAEHADNATQTSGPIRIKNVTTEASGCDKSDCMESATVSVWRMAGWVDGLELLANRFDAGTERWFPHAGTDPFSDPGPTAIVIGECMQDVAILDNEFIGWSTATRIEANGSPWSQNYEGDPACDGRNVDNIRIEGNLVRDSSDRLSETMVPWVLQTAPDTMSVSDDQTIGLVRINNNVVVAEHGLVGCAWMQVWGDSAGPIEYMHDTCLGAIQTTTPTPGAAMVRVVGPRAMVTDPSPLSQLTLQGLLLGGQAEGDVAFSFEVAPADAQSNYNVFSPGATFRWQGGAPVDLDAWRAASSVDDASSACTPEYDADGDFHLADDDECAGDLVVEVENIDIELDIDGDPRGPGPWDAGADERP